MVGTIPIHRIPYPTYLTPTLDTHKYVNMYVRYSLSMYVESHYRRSHEQEEEWSLFDTTFAKLQ